MIRIWATAQQHLTKRAAVVAALRRMTDGSPGVRHPWLEWLALAVGVVVLVATGSGWVAALGGLTLAAAVRAARLVVPKQPAAGAIGPMLLLMAPAFRAVISSPAMFAACGTALTAACAADFARTSDSRRGLAALACTGVVIASAPWLGAVLAVVVAIWLVRRAVMVGHIVAIIAVLAALAVALWIGGLPELSPQLAPLIAASGAGATAVLVGSGLLGAGFAAVTAHPAARLVVALVAMCAAHALLVADGGAPLLVAFAIAVAVIPAAVARAMPPARELVAVAAGVPLVVAAALAGVSAQPSAPEQGVKGYSVPR